MMLAGIFAGALVLALFIGDRLYFRTLSAEASRYGCRVGREEARLDAISVEQIRSRFDQLGLLTLRHGVARWFPDPDRLLLRPRYPTWWAFLWLWPMKGTIDVRTEPGAVVLSLTKRIPWCSAIVTGLWFLVVGVGTIATVISYIVEGGLGSSAGVLMGGGILTLGLLFLFAGVVTVIMAYRMENDRLARLLREFVETCGGAMQTTT